MDNFNEYIEERLIGMYESYNSPVLEEFKKKTDAEKISKHKKEFINYLAYKYQNQDIRYEFQNAKTDAEKEAIIKKYEKDFGEWIKRQKGLRASIISSLTSIGLALTGHVSLSVLFCGLAWGMLIKTTVNDVNAQDKAKEEEYLARRGKK